MAAPRSAAPEIEAVPDCAVPEQLTEVASIRRSGNLIQADETTTPSGRVRPEGVVVEDHEQSADVSCGDCSDHSGVGVAFDLAKEIVGAQLPIEPELNRCFTGDQIGVGGRIADLEVVLRSVMVRTCSLDVVRDRDGVTFGLDARSSSSTMRVDDPSAAVSRVTLAGTIPVRVAGSLPLTIVRGVWIWKQQWNVYLIAAT